MLIPLLKSIAKTLTRQLLEDFLAPPLAFVRWCFKGCQCLRENENDLAKRVGELYQDKRLITLNEGRQAISYKPVAGGDKFADGSTPEEGPQGAPEPSAGDPGTINDDDEDPSETKRLRSQALEILQLAREKMGAT